MTTSNSIDTSATINWLEGVVTKAAVSAEAQALGLPKGTELPMVLRASGVRSQGELSVLAINMTEGALTSDQLTELLGVAFPGAKIGERHGPHYLCLARTGKLAGSRFAIPKATRKPREERSPAEQVAWLEARLIKAKSEVKAEVKASSKPAKA
jgi:hypothetical protein